VLGIRQFKRENEEIKTFQKNNSLAKHKLGIRNNIDAWILMLPMVAILYLFVWRPTVMGTYWSFFNMKAYTVKDFCGLSKDSVVLAEQIRTIDKRRLKEKIGHLDDELMTRVNEALEISFGLL